MKRLILPLASLFLFGASLWAIHQFLQEFHYADIADELKSLTTAQIGWAVTLTAISYLALCNYDLLAVRYVGRPLPWVKVSFAALISYAFSNTIGVSLLTSSSVRYRLYAGWGLSPLDIGKIILFCTVTFWLGILVTGAGVLLLVPETLPNQIPLPGGRWLGALLAIVPTVYLFICFKGRGKRFRDWEFEFPSIGIALLQIVLGVVDWTLAGSVLFALLPADLPMGLVEFLGLYVLAQILSLISHVPGGLGVFESLMLLLLPSELSRATILGAVLAYRLIYYLMPLALAALALGVFESLQNRRRFAALLQLISPWLPSLAPPIFAVWALVSGAVLLVSGATPAVLSRMEWLEDFLPLPVMEFSHFLASLVGAGLLLLARGLQRRLNAAWMLTCSLLALGIGLSLMKGGDYEEALILFMLLLVLYPSRDQFYRRSALQDERFSSGWIVSIGLLLISTTWLGLFSFKHVEYSHDIWWQFSFGEEGDAPRFMRAQVGALTLTLLIGIARLLRPARFVNELPDERALSQAREIVLRSEETYSHLALVGDKHLLFGADFSGFLMYRVEGRSWVAMGDPVGSPSEQRELAWRFRELSELRDGWTVFYQVRPENLEIYVDLGLSLLKIGEEAKVKLAEFTLEGRVHKNLRTNQNKLQKAGYHFEIVPAQGVAELLPELRNVSDAWLADKDTREKQFSLGYFHEPYLLAGPVALARQHGRIVGFANIWLGRSGTEVSVDLMRHLPGVDNGLMDYVFTELMLWAKSGRYAWFNLGMAPLAGLPSHNLAPIWNRFGTLVFGHGGQFYNFRGIRQYKSKFHPVWESRYLAIPHGRHLPTILLNIATIIAGGMSGIVRK